MAPPTDIQRIITDIYGFRTSVNAAEREIKADVDIGNLERYVKLKRVEDIEAKDGRTHGNAAQLNSAQEFRVPVVCPQS